MAIVIIGHGGLTPPAGANDPANQMLQVGLSPNTTLQYYSDYGAGLCYGTLEVQRWAEIKANPPWGKLTFEYATPNFSLQSLRNESELAIAQFAKKFMAGFGDTVISPGVDGEPAQMILCDGSPATCPTGPLTPAQVTAGEAPKQHGCTGILGRFRDHEVHWLACTEFVAPEGDTPQRRSDLVEMKNVARASLAGGPSAVMLGDGDPGDLVSYFKGYVNAYRDANADMRPLIDDYFLKLTGADQLRLWQDSEINAQVRGYLPVPKINRLNLAVEEGSDVLLADADHDPNDDVLDKPVAEFVPDVSLTDTERVGSVCLMIEAYGKDWTIANDITFAELTIDEVKAVLADRDIQIALVTLGIEQQLIDYGVPVDRVALGFS